jgi:hypothetical protein
MDVVNSSQGSTADASELARDRAVITFEAVMQKRMRDGRHNLFGQRRFGLWRHYEQLWPFANAWSATCLLASLEGGSVAAVVLPGFLEGLAHYRRPVTRDADSEPVGFEASVSLRPRRGGETFYDDNAWLGLALMQHHEFDGDEQALSLAHRTFAFIISGWSIDPGWSRPGGVRWKQPVASTSRNTCSNGPVAELGILVYERSGDPGAVEWSIRIYNWVRSALLGPEGLYYDNVSPDGTLDTNIWSYNQGTMIGAGVLLYGVTNDSEYLEQALASAAASIRYFSLQRLTEQEPAFNAIFFRNLLLLDQVVPAAEYRSLAIAYAEAMWQDRREAGSGLFRGEGSPLNNSASMITVYALVAGARPRP